MMNPTPQQQQALEKIREFLDSPSKDVFILNGFAGTGKTTLIREIAKILQEKKEAVKIAATTGRAAKILRDKLAQDQSIEYYTFDLKLSLLLEHFTPEKKSSNVAPISTVHGFLYKPDRLDVDQETLRQLSIFDQPVEDNSSYKLIFKLVKDEFPGVFIIDEASMISDTFNTTSHAHFGSGYLLKDLFDSHLLYKFIFVGDPEQLPPVGQEFSPALSEEYLQKKYNKKVDTFTLTDIVRTNDPDNEILKVAAYIRLQSRNHHADQQVQFYLSGAQNIFMYHPDWKLTQTYAGILKDAWNREKEKGLFDALNRHILISPTNKRVQQLNNDVRQQIFGWNTGLLNIGEILLVTQNNHLHGLYNGDLVQIINIYPSVKRIQNLTLRLIRVKNLADESEKDLFIFLDIFNNHSNNLTQEQQKQLMRDFIIRYKKTVKEDPKLTDNQSTFYRLLGSDPYVNALRAVYGYALTCHKAQGGEWNDVFIDLIPWIASGKFYMNPFKWTYTALTRTKERVHLGDQYFVLNFDQVRNIAEAFIQSHKP